jgi:hypothetical protein
VIKRSTHLTLKIIDLPIGCLTWKNTRYKDQAAGFNGMAVVTGWSGCMG